jgi:RNA polymerase sigma-70 factor (ECF subfamily)
MRGDRPAMTRLVAALLPRARNLVRYLVRDDRDVDDIVQEALMAVLRGLGSYRREGPFEAWADRVVTRATFAWVRRRRTDAAQQASLLERQLPLPPEAEPTTEEYSTRRATVRLLDRLPLEQRQALVLHHVVGMSVPEVAAQLGVPLETARSRLRLGRQRMLVERANTPREEVG